MCMHAKKAMQKLPWEHFSAITCPPALNTNIAGKVIQNTMIYNDLRNLILLMVFLKLEWLQIYLYTLLLIFGFGFI